MPIESSCHSMRLNSEHTNSRKSFRITIHYFYQGIGIAVNNVEILQLCKLFHLPL